MGLFSKKQKEWRTHSWPSRLSYAKDMHKAKKQMNKKQFKEYQRRIGQNIFMKQMDADMRAKGVHVVSNPNSANLKKFVIG